MSNMDQDVGAAKAVPRDPNVTPVVKFDKVKFEIKNEYNHKADLWSIPIALSCWRPITTTVTARGPWLLFQKGSLSLHFVLKPKKKLENGQDLTGG